MEQPREALTEEIIKSLLLLLRVLQKRSASHWIDLDLSLAQMKTLLIIGDLESSSIEQIASVLGVSQPTTSHLVERLVQSKLAHRDQDQQNRRRVLVRLTQAGEELLQHLLGSGTLSELPDRLSGLSEEELATCAQGIHLLVNVITNDPAFLSFTSYFTERMSKGLVRPEKDASPKPEDNA